MDAPSSQFKYRAFMSYSHRDEKVAKWLHRALEVYRVPKPLIGRPGVDGPIPKQLVPIFRDREEFSASPDLSAASRDALEQSAFLIVLCSPSAAQSQWVNQEILEFKRLGRTDRVLAVIVDGIPHAPDPTRECLPPALCFGLDAEGQLTDHTVEPIAADLRPAGDGKEDAKLKLIAGLLGVPFNELRHRELIAARRRTRIYQGIAAAMIVLAGAAATGGWFAYKNAQKAEARFKQSISIAAGIVDEAVEFGQGYGVPPSVIEGLLNRAERAFSELLDDDFSWRLMYEKGKLWLSFAEHYGDVGDPARQLKNADNAAFLLGELARHISADELQVKIARAHELIGDALSKQGKLDKALDEYRESLAIRQKLVAAAPSNAGALAFLAMGHISIGDVLLKQGDVPEALASYTASMHASRDLVAMEPSEAVWQRRLAVSYDRVGNVLREQGKFAEALTYGQEVLKISERLAAADPSDVSRQDDLAAAFLKLGVTKEKMGDRKGARTLYRKAEEIFRRLVALDPNKALWQEKLALTKRRLSAIGADQ